jgi:hypothetical protein
MGKIFALPTAPAAQADGPTLDLWSVTVGSSTGSDQPRDATREEVRQYLLWQAARYGVTLPHDAKFGPAGISAGDELIVPMPGYGQSQTVTCELLDDAGAVVKTMPLPVDRRGKLPMNAAQVQEWTGLAKVKKPRKAAAKPVQPVSAPEAAQVGAAPSADVAALVAAVSALSGRIAELEGTIARAVRGGRVRSDSERRAILRAWRMRREARERAALDRSALLASRAQYLRVETERDALRGDVDRLKHLRGGTAARLTRLRSHCSAQSLELARLRPLGAAILAFSQSAQPAPAPRRTARPKLAAVA